MGMQPNQPLPTFEHDVKQRREQALRDALPANGVAGGWDPGKHERLRLPQCGARSDLFGRGGGGRLAREMNVPYFGEIPIDAAIAVAGDRGVALVEAESAAAAAFLEAVREIERNIETETSA